MEEQYHRINKNNNNNLRQQRQEDEDILSFSSNKFLWISLGLVWITLLLVSVIQTGFATSSKQYQVSMMIRLCIGRTSIFSFSFSID
jgi:hypothetical protein